MESSQISQISPKSLPLGPHHSVWCMCTSFSLWSQGLAYSGCLINVEGRTDRMRGQPPLYPDGSSAVLGPRQPSPPGSCRVDSVSAEGLPNPSPAPEAGLPALGRLHLPAIPWNSENPGFDSSHRKSFRLPSLPGS